MADYCTTGDIIGRQITDSSWNTILGEEITAASGWIDDHCGRQFGKAGTATARVFRASNPLRLDLEGNDIHTTTGLVIKTDPGDTGTFSTTWTTTDYELEPLNGLKSGVAWPTTHIRAVEGLCFPVDGRRAQVQITADWGWASVPERVKRACIIRAGALFLRKQSPAGFIDGFQGFEGLRITRFTDPDVSELLQPFRRADQIVQIG